jgi:hypothetical protein
MDELLIKLALNTKQSINLKIISIFFLSKTASRKPVSTDTANRHYSTDIQGTTENTNR